MKSTRPSHAGEFNRCPVCMTPPGTPVVFTATQHYRATTRATKRQEALAAAVRTEAQRSETRAIVMTGKCPACGAGLRRNSSMTGWWQCEQLGAIGFRKDPAQPSCSWQGFTS